ncbi:MAG: phage Gp19/Gp15/Gp42 family protein [Candidatus Onthomonas sp.]
MEGQSFVDPLEVYIFWRDYSDEDEESRAESLLPVISDVLRYEARRVGKDLDQMLAKGEIPKNVVQSVTVDILARMLTTPTDSPPVTQFSQSANGYTVSGTYLVPGGGLYIKKSELARLGLRRQKMGVIDFAPD